MNIQEIKDWIENNSNMAVDLDKEARKVPQLQATAINFRANENGVLKLLELDLEKIYCDRWIFYSGKASPEVYKAEPFDLKVMKGDIDIFINADPKVRELKSKIENQKIKVAALDEYIKSLNQRTFLIKSVIDWNRLQQGLV